MRVNVLTDDPEATTRWARIPNSTSAFENSPAWFLRHVLDCVRRGNSSFVFISDACAIPMMQKVGATLEEAREYVPIGCYEPGILGREVACTGNGGISPSKAVNSPLNNGRDGLTGEAGRAADQQGLRFV